MPKHVKHDASGNAPWVDANTAQRQPPGWTLAALSPGDQYTDRHGNQWQVTGQDPVQGGIIVHAVLVLGAGPNGTAAT